MTQNKKTEPFDLEEMRASLPDLTIQEQAMVDAWLDGKDQSASYKVGYGAEGYAPNSLKVRASKKFAETRIRAWMQYYRAQGVANSLITSEEHLQRLAELSQKAESTGNYGAAVNAEVNRGKVGGLYVERREDLTKGNATLEQFVDAVREVLGEEQAVKAAENLGMDIETVGNA